MKTLQINIGKLHPTRAACVAGFRAWYSECEHILIDETNIQTYIAEMNAYLGLDYQWPVETRRNIAYLSDRLRFWMCATVPDLVYADTDVFVLDRIQFDKSTTYFGEVYKTPVTDICYMYNGNTLFFEKPLRESIQPQYIQGSIASMVANSVREKIPFETFIHFGSAVMSREIASPETHHHQRGGQ